MLNIKNKYEQIILQDNAPRATIYTNLLYERISRSDEIGATHSTTKYENSSD
jgi:hypothetical protein